MDQLIDVGSINQLAGFGRSIGDPPAPGLAVDYVVQPAAVHNNNSTAY